MSQLTTRENTFPEFANVNLCELRSISLNIYRTHFIGYHVSALIVQCHFINIINFRLLVAFVCFWIHYKPLATATGHALCSLHAPIYSGRKCTLWSNFRQHFILYADAVFRLAFPFQCIWIRLEHVNIRHGDGLAWSFEFFFLFIFYFLLGEP